MSKIKINQVLVNTLPQNPYQPEYDNHTLLVTAGELLLEKWLGSYSRHDHYKISLSIFTAFPVRSYSLNGLASHTLLRESFQGALQQDNQFLYMESYSKCD